MENIQDYEILEKMVETWESVIYKGRRKGEKNTVIIKDLKTQSFTMSQIARLKQDYKTILDLNIKGVIKIQEIISYENRLIYILDDFGGPFISEYLEDNKKFGTELFLITAIQISETLGDIHQKNIIHRNISPWSILYKSDSRETRISAFGLGSEFIYEKNLFRAGDLHKRLLYISPEQTGRMNRIVDYRTDYYLLGATFYTMITGKAPFDLKDPLELIYSHIARKPVPPAELNRDIPVIISDIILKLMSKNAEDRYQSAFGIVSDLKECLNIIRTGSGTKAFELARHDLSVKFIIPQKLFGREKEINILMSAFERISGHQSTDEAEYRPELVLITGSSGIGKSALINEIYIHITEKKGYFISGKYEQFRGDTPYSSIIQAFQKLLRQILTESNDKIEYFKINLLNALGSNTRIITDIIPELELIIGEQSAVTRLGPNETRERFNIVFVKFVSVFTKKEHPVVLSLDDLQWADTASLLLIRNIITDYQIRYLLIIGSFRDNEINETHPLAGIVKEIGDANIKINRIILSELTKDDISSLIINFLKCSEKDGISLAELIIKKTGGNPFFVREFLFKLYEEKLIVIDPQSGWKWDIEKINNMSITNNVVELLTHKIKNLPNRIQDVLKLCACMGNRFDLETLSFLLDKSIDDTLRVLTEAVNEGFVTMTGDIYFFNHDRIQEIAYSLVNDDEKPLIHYMLGRLILKKTGTADFQNKLFYIVDQLNLGSGLIDDSKEREELAQLNLKSGIKAKESAAIIPALKYLNTALNLLEKRCWEDQYDLTLGVYTEAAEAAYLNGDYDLMDHYASIVIKSAGNIYDALPVYFTKIHTCNVKLNFKGSLEIAFDIFKKLNFLIPKKPDKVQVFFLLLKIRLYIFFRGIDSFINLPEMTDRRMLAVAQIFAVVSLSSYFVSPDLFIYIPSKQIALSIKYGLCQHQIISFIEIASVFNCIIGKIETGYKLANLALKLIKQLNARNYELRVQTLYYGMIAHWKEHLKSIRPEFMNLHHLAMESGDLERIADCIYMYDHIGFLLGSELQELEPEIAKNHKLIEQTKQSHFLGYHSVIWQIVSNLIDKSDKDTELSGVAIDKEKMLPLWESSDARVILKLFYTYRLMLRYLLCDYNGAMADSNTLDRYLDSSMGHLVVYDGSFYSSLVRLAVYPGKFKTEKLEYKRFVRQSIKEFKKWAKHAPMNNLHRLYIIKAERARTLGKQKSAESLYDKAIELCRKYEYPIEEAIANELAARYYISRGRLKLASVYLNDAFICYEKWGAIVKLRQLREMYPELLSKQIHLANSISSQESGSGIIDLKTVIKASQAISGEVALGKLLEKMMNIAMENAGARKGFIILESKGNFFVEAEAEIEKKEVKVLNSIPVESHDSLSSSIIHYVTRTNELLILDDASGRGDFMNDPYILKTKPKSILCTPILNQGRLTGVLYLENNLSAGVFNKERLEVLKLLSSQMAISIENAKFYKNLEEKVMERTANLSKEINERKKIEEQLIISNKELESFAYMVSHDLQEPLRKIITFGSQINNDLPSDKITDYLRRIRNAAKRMQDLINGLLNYSRVTTKIQPFRNVDLNIIVRDVISDLEVRIRDTNGTIETGKLPVVNADALQIRQLFQNLLGNALKFHKKNEAPKINVYKKNDVLNDYHTIIVEDNGIGIDKNDYDKLFGVFQRLHGRSEYEGSGVGLAICKKIMEKHGGKISIDGTPGVGTKFIIDFPIN